MQRFAVLGALVTVGALTMTAAAYQTPAGPKVIDIEKIKPMPAALKGTTKGSEWEQAEIINGMSDGTGMLGWAWVKEEGITTVEQLKAYLRETPPPHDYGRVLLLWASTRMKGLIDSAKQKELALVIRSMTGIENAAVHQQLPRHARAHRLDQNRNGNRGKQPVAHGGQAESGVLGGDGKVTGEHQADTAAHRRAVDPGDRRFGKIIDRLHRSHHRIGAGMAGDGVEFGPGQNPVEVAARRKDLSRARQHHHTHRAVDAEGLDRVANGA